MVDTDVNRDAEVETQIMLLELPIGGGPHDRERERAAAWLLQHADRAYPRILASLTDGTAGANVIAVTARFNRKESIPPLAKLLFGQGSTAWIVGHALAQHTDPTAGEALRRAVVSSNSEVAVAAADALGTRADPGDCGVLMQALATGDASVRYHVLQAASPLGCIQPDLLKRMAREDEDADVRDLASRLLGNR
jgi:hypothetical protein